MMKADDDEDMSMNLREQPPTAKHQQQPMEQHRLLQPVLIALSLITFIALLALGPSILADNDNKMEDVTKLSGLRSLQDPPLVPKTEYYKQFYEYQSNSSQFHLYRNPNGHMHVMINATNNLLRMECHETTPTILNCSNNRMHSSFDIYKMDDANTTESGFCTILYTGIDGSYYHVEDITWIQDKSIDHTSTQSNVPCENVLGVFVYCHTPSQNKNQLINGISNGVVISWIIALGIIFCVISTLCLRQFYIRTNYRKRMIQEIAEADAKKYSDNTYSTSEDDATELFDFRDVDSNHLNFDPTELKEVDLSE